MNKERINQIILLAGLVLLLFFSSFASAKPEYASKESKACSVCHTRDGPPQLGEIGVYYATHNHSLEGYVPAPKVSPTPPPEKEIDIGVHMTTWDVGIKVFAIILLILVLVYAIRL